MPLRLYADECVDARVVAGLRRRDADIVTAADENLLGAADEEHLERAEALGRIIVTNDQDFLRLASARVEDASGFGGLVFVLPETRVGEAVAGIFLLTTILEPLDMANRIEWVP